ncbi:MAG: murein biosynthesis integral membrane protein MurJ, partial [Gemmatimonadota bacterium]|nr:murein biosynthesis integral membrane protein MurJ [Gemmatimonadota bacterium]
GRTGRSAASVGAGILTSRLTGFLRDIVIAATFGAGSVMDAYTAALRIPNILRNLLGEGTLSASFVPVYSAALGRGDHEEARETASGVLGIVLAVSTLVVALGIGLAPWLARLLTPGFDAELSSLTASLIRILFPMSGLMIAGAWCLGVLTSHRRFFLPFAAPVAWNLAQIAGLLIAVRVGWEPLIMVLAWATLAGAVLQVLVQLPSSARLAGTLVPRLRRPPEPVRRVVRNAGPVAAGQGIFQVSSLADVMLASTLVSVGAAGALSGMYYAQRIVQLPMAVFGVAVAVAALPEMSRDGALEALRPHLASGVRQILYFILPAVVILLVYGDLVIAVIYQRGAFDAEDARLVRWLLSAYAAGLVATSLVKLFASGFHALQDTRTPMRYAAVSVAIAIGLGAALMFAFAGAGLGQRAATGLAIGGAVGAWLNLILLSRGLGRRGLIGVWRAGARPIARLALGAALAGGVSWPVRLWTDGRLGAGTFGAIAELLAVLGAGGIAYIAVAGTGPLRRIVRS